MVEGKSSKDNCKHGGCNYTLQRNSAEVIHTDQFQCPKAFQNPQYPCYILCQDKKYDEGDKVLCPEFRGLRRRIAMKSGMPMQRYVQILKQRALRV